MIDDWPHSYLREGTSMFHTVKKARQSTRIFFLMLQQR
jgi:hypothetical protein